MRVSAESHSDCGKSLPLPPLAILCGSWDSTTVAVAVCRQEHYLVVLKNMLPVRKSLKHTK